MVELADFTDLLLDALATVPEVRASVAALARAAAAAKPQPRRR